MIVYFKLLIKLCFGYMPAFFYMNLKFPFYDSPVVLYNLPKSDLAAFVHEYVHFIQDITTYWGLNNAYVYSEYIHGAVNQIYQYPKGSFCVPFRISNNSNNMNSSASNAGPTPYDFGDTPEPKGTDVDSNPFADFGNSIEISDDELPF